MKPYQLDIREVRFRKCLDRPRLPGRIEVTDDKGVHPFSLFGDREVFGVATEDGIQFALQSQLRPRRSKCRAFSGNEGERVNGRCITL